MICINAIFSVLYKLAASGFSIEECLLIRKYQLFTTMLIFIFPGNLSYTAKK